MAKKSWYKAKTGKTQRCGEVAILSDIGGWGVTAQDFYESLAALGELDQLDVVISSDGGDVTTGFAIFDMLNRHKANKTVRVVGLAASMASVIAMVGDEVVMPSNAMMMIHNPWGGVVGDSDQLRNFANVLDMMRENIKDAYVKRTGLSVAEVSKLMDAETWLTADKALNLGFADRVDAPVESNARFHLAKFCKVPKSLRAYSEESEMNDKTEDPAKTAGTTVEAPNEDAIRESILAQHKEVRALCKVAGKPQLAEGFIEANVSPEGVIAALEKAHDDEVKAAEAAAKTEINTRTVAATDDKANTKVVDTTDVYARFNSAKRK